MFIQCLRRGCYAAILPFLFLFPCIAMGVEGVPSRTFNTLAAAELDILSKVTHEYYMCVLEKLPLVEKMATDRGEPMAPGRIIAEYPPYIKIVRQQCRIRLINVEKTLYGFNCNPEFITNYANTLRDDVVYFVLQHAVTKKNGPSWGNNDEFGDDSVAGSKDGEKKDTSGSTGNPGSSDKASKQLGIPGLDIFTTPPSARNREGTAGK